MTLLLLKYVIFQTKTTAFILNVFEKQHITTNQVNRTRCICSCCTSAWWEPLISHRVWGKTAYIFGIEKEMSRHTQLWNMGNLLDPLKWRSRDQKKKKKGHGEFYTEVFGLTWNSNFCPQDKHPKDRILLLCIRPCVSESTHKGLVVPYKAKRGNSYMSVA